jgi:hypothetical protein
VAGAAGAGGFGTWDLQHSHPPPGVDGSPGVAGSCSGSVITAKSGQALLINSILHGNASVSSVSGPLSDGGHNLCSDSTAGFVLPSSRNNIDPKISVLASNGGPTLTIALLSDSPAIDAGSTVSGAGTDQRGFARGFNSTPDIGAYEFGAGPPPVLLSHLRAQDGAIRFQASGTMGTIVRLQESTNLTSWNDVETNIVGIQGFAPFQAGIAASADRFYRTVSP